MSAKSYTFREALTAMKQAKAYWREFLDIPGEVKAKEELSEIILELSDKINGDREFDDQIGELTDSIKEYDE